MKVLFLAPATVAPFLLAGCASMLRQTPPVGQHPRQLRKTIKKTVNIRYLLYLPNDYGKTRQRWPMILFLHGAGERGNDLELVKKHGPPKIVEQKRDFPFIVVSPQCPKDGWWSNDVLIALLDEIAAKYRVDPDRVYLTGLSMGGFGTWELATAHPERFAAIAPICGRGLAILAGRLKDVPAWVFHGAKDNLIPLKESEVMVDALRRAGGDVKFTVYPEAEHDSWTDTYNNPQLYDWFLQHKRKSSKRAK